MYASLPPSPWSFYMTSIEIWGNRNKVLIEEKNRDPEADRGCMIGGMMPLIPER